MQAAASASGSQPTARRLRVLLTGFGPFPGAPFNPTPALVARLLRLRRPALDGVDLTGHIFQVTYQTVDRELPDLLARHRPDALLMFGLADRTPYVRVETRARNAVTMLWPDADHTRVRKGSIAPGVDALSFGPHTAKLLRAARATGVDVRASRNAGSYLCNYLSWRAIEATRTADGPALAAFVHVPLVARDAGVRRNATDRITSEELVDTGEAVLIEMIRQTRGAVREQAIRRLAARVTQA
jgi:pyroglutamyl-peptidase